MNIERHKTGQLPSPGALDEFELAVSAIYEMRVALAAERRKRREVRDALLPELMSGRIRVKDAEKAVEEVL